MRLCTKDVEIFLHFHAFLQADSGMGSFLTPALTSRKNPTEPPVVRTTELSSMAPGERSSGRRLTRGTTLVVGVSELRDPAAAEEEEAAAAAACGGGRGKERRLRAETRSR